MKLAAAQDTVDRHFGPGNVTVAIDAASGGFRFHHGAGVVTVDATAIDDQSVSRAITLIEAQQAASASMRPDQGDTIAGDIGAIVTRDPETATNATETDPLAGADPFGALFGDTDSDAPSDATHPSPIDRIQALMLSLQQHNPPSRALSRVITQLEDAALWIGKYGLLCLALVLFAACNCETSAVDSSFYARVEHCDARSFVAQSLECGNLVGCPNDWTRTDSGIACDDEILRACTERMIVVESCDDAAAIAVECESACALGAQSAPQATADTAIE